MQAEAYKVLTSTHRTESPWEENERIFDEEKISLLV